ncbi:hypothetical protein BD410DRAFT_808226 [Rickenella mellea]|uniref:Uncharacterized protein n=1 Tax=Rickenella mellea TaxID=50990 RepID=A0A4Y7PP15_9AGAM|nr:hypothetical protein BD410DRAFT_808226 [Rickenella mellea]
MNPTAIPFSHSRTICALSFDPTGYLVAAGFTNGRITVWSFFANNVIYDEAFSSASEITSIAWAFTGDALTLLCGARDGTIVVSSPVGFVRCSYYIESAWLTVEQEDDGKVVGFTSFRGHISAVIGLLDFLPGFVSASAGELSLWSCPDGIQCEMRLSCDLSGISHGASLVGVAEAHRYSLWAESVIWCITNSANCGPSLYTPHVVIICTEHRCHLAMTGKDCPRIRQIAATATYLSPVEESEYLFLIRTLEGNVIVWDAEHGDVLFYLDIRDFGKQIHKLAAYYDPYDHLLRIVACPEHSTECVVWNLHRCNRQNPATPMFATWRNIKVGAPTVPKRVSKRRKANGLQEPRPTDAVAASVALRRSTRQRRVPARFLPLSSTPVV